MKHYPHIDDSDDIGGVDEEPNFYEEEEHHDEETYKDEASPNEACYFDIEPLEPNTLIPFNDSIAKAKAFKYK